MNTAANASHDGHAAAEARKFYHGVNLALFMAAVTGIELVIIFMPLPDWFILFWVVVLSAVKFFGVITWFMHLVYDKALLAILFVSGLILAGGTAAALLFLFQPDHFLMPADFENAAVAAPSSPEIARVTNEARFAGTSVYLLRA